VECDTKGATIYYTLDGTVPDESSIEYTAPFTLDQSCTVKACAYKDGLKPGYVTEKFISVYDPEKNGVNYEYFLGKWEVLPDFNTLVPENSGTVYSFNLGHIQTRESNFGIRFQGFVDIPKEDEYTFYVNSDDGSRLFIDGKQLVDNDGLHGVLEKSGRAKLTTGKHAIRVDYMQGGDGMEIGISWEGPGFGKQRLGAYSLFKN
jgi:hypothetical protein